jgi:hypothetical protein
MREVPLRSTQVHGSNPLWASGAVAEASFGPFISLDGRRFWFDFFRIEKLVALYVQGVAEPALLFKLRTRFRFIGIDLPLAADAAPGYHLNAGSIWINSRLLATNAPPGFFTGLTIRSGNIELSAAPQIVDGRLTIAPSTTVRVELQLAQQTVNDADPSAATARTRARPMCGSLGSSRFISAAELTRSTLLVTRAGEFTDIRPTLHGRISRRQRTTRS